MKIKTIIFIDVSMQHNYQEKNNSMEVVNISYRVHNE